MATTKRSTSSTATRSRGRDGVSSSRRAAVTVPTLSDDDGRSVADALQQRLVSLIDLSLTLKHIHWNVVGPQFISVHQMLDPQYDGVSAMVDDLAERVATLGGVPSGLPGRLVEIRSWDDYSLDRADAIAHLGALDLVYDGVVTGHREAIEAVGDIDPISKDILIGQTRDLEQYQWFVRSHLMDWAGGISNAGASSEMAAARSVARKPARRSSRRAAS